MTQALDRKLFDEILSYGPALRAARERGDLAAGEAMLLAAWSKVPEPKDRWDIAGIIMRELVGFYVAARRASDAQNWLARWETYMSDSPGVVRDSFAGRTLLDLGLADAAYSRLLAAYRDSGTRPFQDLDPRYLSLVRTRLAAQGEHVPEVAADPGELPDDIHEQVEALSERAEAHFSRQEYKQAIDLYWTALALLPPPETQWEAATWLLTGIGDAHYLSRQFPRAIEALYNAMNCPDAAANAFVNLRLGQALFDAGQRDKAMSYLTRAYALAGDEIFEDGGEQHLAALKKVIKT